MKVDPIPNAIFETTSLEFKFCISVFFNSDLVYFGQKEPIEVKFSDFWVVGENSSNSSCHIWNHKSVFL